MEMGGREEAWGAVFRSRTSGVRVAVNRQVCRKEEGGRASRHVPTSGTMLPAPEASRRSASSRTTIFVLWRPHMVSVPDVLMWSASLPGVAITI